MDKVDRRIASLLQENPHLTQAEIAKALGIAQSSAGLRLSRLKRSKVLFETDVINYDLLGMTMCRVDVDTTNPEALMDWCSKCLLFVNSIKGIGKTVMSLFFLGEDFKTFHSIIDEHVRKIDGVRDLEMTIIESWERPFFLKLDLRYSNLEDPPCGTLPFCTKCPANRLYDGRVWNNQRLFKEIIGAKLKTPRSS